MRKRRGSVYERSDGLWVAALSRTIDGLRKRDVLYASSEEDARANLQELRTLADVDARPSREALGPFLDAWLQTVQRQREAGTYDDYERQVRLYVKPVLGKVKLRGVTSDAIEQLLTGIDSARTRLKVYVVLSAAFKYARRKRLVPENPMDFVDKPAYEPKPRHPWTLEEAQRFFAAIKGDRFEALYMLAIDSGMREGELFALEPADLDLAAGTVSPRSSLQNIAGKRKTKGPKTVASRRRIDIGSDVVSALRRHLKRKMVDGPASPYVFCDRKGGALQRSNFLAREWYPLLERNKLRRITVHDLRHTMATIMFGLNEHPKVVQEKLGHSRISTTLDTYSHVIPTMGGQAADRLQRALRRTPKAK